MHAFGLYDDWSPAPPSTTPDDHEELAMRAIDWHLVSRGGSAHDGHEWLVLYDSSATYAQPGQDDMTALHLVRDLATHTYTLDGGTFPTVASAEGWLLAHGADDLEREMGMPEPDDDTTREIEDRVRRNFPHYDRSYSFVDHDAYASRVVFFDQAARDPEHAFLAHVEYRASNYTYAIREKPFATADAAKQWTNDYQPPEPLTISAPPSRTAAARAHSTAAPTLHAADSPTRVVEIVPPHRPTRKP